MHAQRGKEKMRETTETRRKRDNDSEMDMCIHMYMERDSEERATARYTDESRGIGRDT